MVAGTGMRLPKTCYPGDTAGEKEALWQCTTDHFLGVTLAKQPMQLHGRGAPQSHLCYFDATSGAVLTGEKANSPHQTHVLVSRGLSLQVLLR